MQNIIKKQAAENQPLKFCSFIHVFIGRLLSFPLLVLFRFPLTSLALGNLIFIPSVIPIRVVDQPRIGVLYQIVVPLGISAFF